MIHLLRQINWKLFSWTVLVGWSTSITSQVKTSSESEPSLLQCSCICRISCHFLTQWSTNSGTALSDSSSVVIYDLHTFLHKHHLTQTYNQLARRQQEWSGDDCRGYTRSVPGALDWQVGSCYVGKLKTKQLLSLENPLHAPWKERKGERIRKRRREQGMMFSIVFLLQWKCHYRPPCVCVQLCASHIKALRLCLIIREHL